MRERGDALQPIDVREPEEAELCSIGGELIPAWVRWWTAWTRCGKDMPVVLHCRSGKRSAAVIDALSSRYGFDNLINLQGGILAWAQEVDPTLDCG